MYPSGFVLLVPRFFGIFERINKYGQNRRHHHENTFPFLQGLGSFAGVYIRGGLIARKRFEPGRKREGRPCVFRSQRRLCGLYDECGAEPGEGSPEDYGYEIVEAKLPEQNGGAQKEFDEKTLSTHCSQALVLAPDENGAYYGDYIIIYNPEYNSAAKSTGTLTGLIETSVVNHLGEPEEYAEREADENAAQPFPECGTALLAEEYGEPSISSRVR